MPIIVERGTCSQEGVGKPDYSKGISSAIERAGIRVKYNQRLKIFALVFSNTPSVFPWVQTPIAAGASAHLIDQETGLATPYNLSAGYISTLVTIRFDLSQDHRFEIIYDAFPAGGLIVSGIHPGGMSSYVEDILPFTTALLDPTAASAHTLDYVLTNLGTSTLYGHMARLGILEAVGTPPLPTTKTTKCPFCGNEEVKPVTTTEIICSACSKLYRVYDLTRYKGG